MERVCRCRCRRLPPLPATAWCCPLRSLVLNPAASGTMLLRPSLDRMWWSGAVCQALLLGGRPSCYRSNIMGSRRRYPSIAGSQQPAAGPAPLVLHVAVWPRERRVARPHLLLCVGWHAEQGAGRLARELLLLRGCIPGPGMRGNTCASWEAWRGIPPGSADASAHTCTPKRAGPVPPPHSRARGLREQSTHTACATPGSQPTSVSSRLTQK